MSDGMDRWFFFSFLAADPKGMMSCKTGVISGVHPYVCPSVPLPRAPESLRQALEENGRAKRTSDV